MLRQALKQNCQLVSIYMASGLQTSSFIKCLNNDDNGLLQEGPASFEKAHHSPALVDRQNRV